jgi:thioredoxin-related protein
MSICRLPLGAILVFAAALTGSKLQAQEVRWRTDYAAARKEATDSGRPLLVDFGTEQCVWCRKLDITTFRDPAVAKLITDKFVPVKIDAREEAWLTEALRVRSLPTLFLAAPDGIILATRVGYVDAMGMTRLLEEALQKSTPTTDARRETPSAAARSAPAPYDRRCEITYGTVPASPAVRPQAP